MRQSARVTLESHLTGRFEEHTQDSVIPVTGSVFRSTYGDITPGSMVKQSHNERGRAFVRLGIVVCTVDRRLGVMWSDWTPDPQSDRDRMTAALVESGMLLRALGHGCDAAGKAMDSFAKECSRFLASNPVGE